MKANQMHCFSSLFDKVLYMFRTCPLSIIRSISTLYTRNRYVLLGRCTLNYKKRVPNYLLVTTHVFEKCKACKKTLHNFTCGCKIFGFYIA